MIDGDVVYGSVMAGQIAGMLKKKETCAEIIQDVVGTGEALLRGER